MAQGRPNDERTTSLTLHAIKMLTFMSEFRQVVVVGEACAPVS
jgi:hypothetical protein